MASKDLTSKNLESEPDVFADIFNVLLLGDQSVPIFKPEFTLEDTSTEGIYYDDEKHRVRNMFQDISKRYKDGETEVYLACFNIENESQVKRTVPLKCFGYKYTALKKQESEYNNKRRALMEVKTYAQKNDDIELVNQIDNQLKELGKFKTIPFISIVLNFDDKEWDEPTDLAELNIDSPYSQFDESFHIKVFNVKSFDEELRSKFKSDFRIFLEMFCTNTLPSELGDVKLKHPTKLIDMILAFVQNANLERVRKTVAMKELNEEAITMGDIFDRIANEAAYKAAYEKVVKDANAYYKKGVNDKIIIEVISENLDISIEEAKELFEREVLGLALN